MTVSISFRDKLVLTLVLSAIVLSMILSAALYFVILHKYHIELRKKASVEAERYIFDYNHVVSDGRVILDHLYPLLQKSDPLEEIVAEESLREMCLMVLQTRRELLQIRVLNAAGMEQLRVERNRKFPGGRITPEGELTDKSHRYYVDGIRNQTPGAVWISRLDLNMERHAVEVPHQPTLRIARGLYRADRLVGMVVINLDMSINIQELTRSTLFKPVLVDQKGEILLHPGPKYCWSRSLEHPYNIFRVDPELSRPLATQDHHYDRERALYVAKFFENSDVGETLWLLLYPLNDIDTYAWKLLQIIVLINVILIPLHMFAAYLISRGYRRLEKTQKMHEELLIQKTKMSSIGEMISFIAHQWRQPLNAIAGAMIRMRTDAELERYSKATLLGFLDQQEQRLTYLSETIETFRKFYTPDTEAVNFALIDAVEQVLQLIGPALREENIALERGFEEDGVLRGRRNEFMQVVLSIINNSRAVFSERETGHPTIRLRTYRLNGFLCLEIHDNAGGIDSEPIDKIFKPYFSTRSSRAGTGIGLYLSRLIIEQHFDGTLDARNRMGGALFTITFRKSEPQE